MSIAARQIDERRLAELCGLMVDERITEGEAGELDGMLAASAAARRAYGVLIDTHLDLAERRIDWSAVEASAEPGKAVLAVIEPDVARRPAASGGWRLPLAAVLLIAGGAAALLIAALVGGSLDRDAVPAGPAVAVLIDVDGVTWASEPRHAGDELSAGSLAILSGRIELNCRDGSEVTITGPAELTLARRDRIELRHGRLHARAVSGFTVSSPRFDVVDQGTEFDITVEPDGAGRVFVWDGRVEVRSGGQAVEPLLAGEGVRCSSGGRIDRLDDAERHAYFLLWGGYRYVHYAFDEAQGERIADTGMGFDGGPFDAHLDRADAAQPLRRIDGVVGRAIELVPGTHLTTRFDGITGGAARTIAFWVRVPAKASIDTARSIVAWGDADAGGAGWQIEWNWFGPAPTLGTVRLYLGGSSVVTGSTDLRDGKWHHVAVVLDAAQAPRAERDVRLYVDGEPDAISRVSGGPIDTASPATGTADHSGRKPAHASPLVIGRDLRGGGQSAFRGALDELYIFDGALDQSMVRRLMNENPKGDPR